MCGFYGIAKFSGSVDLAIAKSNGDRLIHRGPDSSGDWKSTDGRVALVHRRLSILDLSSNGAQPMSSQSGRFTVAFNGEIYNFREIRCELEDQGVRFISDSDTEVLLAAWEHWGERCLERFNGMYAFALHDSGAGSAQNSLYLVRDRVGKKPLYYAYSNGVIEFGSELKCLSGQYSLDLNALNHYLSLGYVPHDLCIAQGVKKLPPAHVARIDLNTFDMSVSRYWALPINNPNRGITGEFLADEAETLLLNATSLRLFADVPVGVLLSGGLDSSLVAAAAARSSNKSIETFTITLPGSSLDESGAARQIASYLGANHHELAISANGLDEFSKLLPYIDEPLADSSILPTFLVSRLTRQHVTVALGGDGGDELFGGYDDYPRSLADHRRLEFVPLPLFRSAGALAARLPAGIPGRNRIASLSRGPLRQMIWGRPYFDWTLRQSLLTRKALDQLGKSGDAPEHFLSDLFDTGRDPVDCMTRTHFGSILPDDFLVKVDRASMVNSLEVRAPLLDFRLVEFAFGRIPSEWKVKNDETRRVQRILAKRWLPDNLDFSRKQGFSIPLDQWLRSVRPSWHDQWIERLPDSINRDVAKSLVTGLGVGRTNGSRIFALAMLAFASANMGWS